MDIKLIQEMAKDPNARAEIINVIAELKQEFYPMLTLLKETIGEDADGVVDDVLMWSARKTTVLFNAFMQQGFSREESLALVCNSRREIAASLRSAK